jgi:ankyrin repeat protein
MPAIHQAILADSIELLQLLLDRGLKPEGLDSGGLTPLQYAVVNQRSPQLIPLLIKAGANPNERIQSSSTERTRDLSGNQFDVKDQFPLMIALRKASSP